VEQLVFRALHKEAGVRFASGRELARALRQVQGHSVPLELQTGVVRVPMRAAPPRPWRVPRTWLWTAAALALVAGVGVAWIAFWRPPRAFVAVAPVVNATGDRTLDPYRLGLTLALTRELGVSPDIRVFPYQQMLQPLRRFLLAGADPSGADAVAAIGASSGAPVVIVPTLSYDRGAWTAQADLRDPKAGTSVGRVQTDALESSLTKEAAATLIARLAATVEARFARTRWWPGSVAPPVRFQSLDAARAFEEGVNAYDAAEFASARDAFGRAAREDPRHPLPVAWSSRIAQIVGDRNAAAEAADRAEGLLSTASSGDRLFVEAVVAESRRQIENAARAYQALADATPDDTSGWLELAAFDDRSGRTAEAIATYRQVLDADARLPGPALELCRLYNSTRMNDATQARAFGDQARRGYANLGSTAGEAQAKLCLADILRGGTPEERAQARRLSAEALAAFQGLGLRYGVARAQHYVAMTARAQDDLVAAAASWEQALASAKAVGNTSLEGTVYTNLGVTHNALGNRGKALDYYRQSYEMAERRGDERRAAYSRANAGALLIEYGDAPDEGLRFIEGALRVVRRLEDKNFEVFCLQLISVHYRFTGRYADARAAIDQAIAIARERNFVDAIPALLLEQGRVRMEMGEYVAARETFTQALGSEGATEAGELQIELARVQARLGDAEAAASALEKAQMSPEANAGDVEPRLLAAAGEVAYAAGRLQDARASYEAAGRLWTDELPDAASVEGRAFVGLLDALDGRAAGRPAIDTGLQQARRMQRPSLEALCRMWLARLDLRAGRPAQAASLLAPIRLDRIGPELQAQVHYWRAQASATPGAGDDERRDARRLLDEIQRGVPDRLRARFLLRPDIQVMAN
jgi:tetratricopeptide (TPR) repeat protein